MDVISTSRPTLLQTALSGWQSAWAAMHENPLLLYLDTTRRRAAARVPVWQKIALVFGAAAMVLGLAYVFYLDQVISQSGFALGFDVVAIVLTIAICGFYAIWLFQGIYNLIASGMRLLAAPGKRSVALQMDDMLSLTSLSDYDVLLAGLRILLPPMLLRVFVGALLSWYLLLLFASETFQDFNARAFWQVLIMGPLTVACMCAVGALGSLCLLLLSVCLGRAGQVDTPAVSSSLLSIAFQSVWAPMTFVLAVMATDIAGGGDETDISCNWAFVLGLLLATVLLLSIAGLAEEQGWLRRGLALAWPLLLLISGALYVGFGIAFWFSDSPPAWFAQLGFGYFSGWGGFAPLNPLAIPSIVCVGADAEWSRVALSNMFVSPLASVLRLTLLQLPLAAGLLHFGVRAVKLRRAESV